MTQRQPKKRRPPKPPRDPEGRRADQRRIHRDRLADQALRQRLEQPDVLPQREGDDEGPYRP